jgi:hypothetical protein
MHVGVFPFFDFWIELASGWRVFDGDVAWVFCLKGGRWVHGKEDPVEAHFPSIVRNVWDEAIDDD